LGHTKRGSSVNLPHFWGWTGFIRMQFGQAHVMIRDCETSMYYIVEN